MRCPKCGGVIDQREDYNMVCTSCGRVFRLREDALLSDEDFKPIEWDEPQLPEDKAEKPTVFIPKQDPLQQSGSETSKESSTTPKQFGVPATPRKKAKRFDRVAFGRWLKRNKNVLIISAIILFIAIGLFVSAYMFFILNKGNDGIGKVTECNHAAMTCADEVCPTCSLPRSEMTVEELSEKKHKYDIYCICTVCGSAGHSFNQSGTCEQCGASNVLVEDGVLVGAGTFAGSDLVIPHNVKSIGEFAFYGCSRLTSVSIPTSVTSLGNACFKKCTGLTEIAVGRNVAVIPRSAFEGCTGLASVTFGATLTKIDDYAFDGCTGITDLFLSDTLIAIGEAAFRDCKGLSSVIFGKRLTAIGNSAFLGCSGLTSLPLNNRLTSIGEYAFYGCSGLTKVEIPNSVSTIGKSTFAACTSLTEVTLSSSLTDISDNLFMNCTSLASVSIPDKVSRIGISAFSGCQNLKSVTMTDELYIIDQYAFYSCHSLGTITLSKKLKTIGRYAFANCTNLTGIYIKGFVQNWDTISKGEYWDENTAVYTLYFIPTY